MPKWVRILTVLTTLPLWCAVIIVDLAHNDVPSPALMAIPAGVIVATTGIEFIRYNKKPEDEGKDQDK